MAILEKRGKYYYARWQAVTEDGRKDVRKSLGLKSKPVAQEALNLLEELEEKGCDLFAHTLWVF